MNQETGMEPLNPTQRQDKFAALSVEFYEKSKEVTVIDDEGYNYAGTLMTMAHQKIKAVKEFMDPDIAKANDLHKSLTRKRNTIIFPLEGAKKIIGKVMSDFQAEVARKQAVERARIAREQREEDEAARKVEEDRRAEEAQAAEDAGDTETADAIMEAPLPQTTQQEALPPTEAPKAEGVSFRSKFKAEVFDKSLIPAEYLIPDLPKIQKIVTAYKGDIKIAGVKITEIRIPVTRS